MKRYFLLLLLLFMYCIISGQSAGKIGGVNANSIIKVGSVPIGTINRTGNVTTQIIYNNCKEIKQNNPTAIDGVYTIDPDGEGTIEPFNCFCDMTTDGGGWTMVGYYKDPSNYQDLLLARSDNYFGTGIADPNSTTSWTDWRVLAGAQWPLQFAVVLDQPTYTTWADLNAKVIYRVKNRNIMPNYGTTQDLVTSDNLYYKFYFPDGYADVNLSSSSSDIQWYPLHASGTYLICFHNTVGYTSYYGSGVPGGNNTWHHSARLLIR